MTHLKLVIKTSAPHSDFVGYPEVRHTVKSDLEFPVLSILCSFEGFLLKLSLTAFKNRKLISYFYGPLYLINCVNVEKLRQLWGKDLEVNLDAKM